ncbi:hypothetical protein EDB80DRAFT_814076 [Ilyonectria destructans]|nr:hypothetical protein EDB80DRAFT_814076 [Ilyonectria destructans]
MATASPPRAAVSGENRQSGSRLPKDKLPVFRIRDGRCQQLDRNLGRWWRINPPERHLRQHGRNGEEKTAWRRKPHKLDSGSIGRKTRTRSALARTGGEAPRRARTHGPPTWVALNLESDLQAAFRPCFGIWGSPTRTQPGHWSVGSPGALKPPEENLLRDDASARWWGTWLSVVGGARAGRFVGGPHRGNADRPNRAGWSLESAGQRDMRH